MELPQLSYDFRDAHIESVSIGPRREVTLTIAPITWEGPNAHRAHSVRVRFGSIANFEEVTAFFGTGVHATSELAWLGYHREKRSRPGSLHMELAFERVDEFLDIECGNVQINEIESLGLS